PKRPPRPAAQQPPPPGRPAKPPRRPRRFRRWGAMLVVLLLVAAGGAVAGGLWLDTTLQRVPVLADYPDRPPAGDGTTWLLVGSDSRAALSVEQQDALATGGD